MYKARDTRLDRMVAVKVLPGHLSGNEELRQRFDREAKAISALSHPHICALYDVGHQDGVDYLVMEYLEGDPLSDRLAKGRAADRPGGPIRNPDRRRPRQGAPAGHRPPGSQARKHHDHEVGREAPRLRARQIAHGDSGQRLLRPLRWPDAGRREPDRAGDDPRDVPVHGARAARGAGGRRAKRHLLVRCRALRDGDRQEALRRKEPGVADCGHPRRDAAAGFVDLPDDAARARPGREDVPRERPRRPVPDCARRAAPARVGRGGRVAGRCGRARRGAEEKSGACGMDVRRRSCIRDGRARRRLSASRVAAGSCRGPVDDRSSRDERVPLRRCRRRSGGRFAGRACARVRCDRRHR